MLHILESLHRTKNHVQLAMKGHSGDKKLPLISSSDMEYTLWKHIFSCLYSQSSQALPWSKANLHVLLWAEQAVHHQFVQASWRARCEIQAAVTGTFTNRRSRLLGPGSKKVQCEGQIHPLLRRAKKWSTNEGACDDREMTVVQTAVQICWSCFEPHVGISITEGACSEARCNSDIA